VAVGHVVHDLPDGPAIRARIFPGNAAMSAMAAARCDRSGEACGLNRPTG
jgi:hypothetical protein